jgi:hypothetical protein
VNGARKEPNITITVSGDDVTKAEPITTQREVTKCHYYAQKIMNVTMNADKGIYEAKCIVQDGDFLYDATKTFGTLPSSAPSVLVYSSINSMAVIFILKFIL